MPEETTTPQLEQTEELSPLDEAAASFFTEDAPASPEPDGADAATGATAPEGEAGTGDGGREGVPPSPEPQTPDVIDLGDGIQLSREQARQWAEFGQYLRDNPQSAQAVAAALEAQQNPPEPEPAKPPAGVDLDDPAIAALWEQHQTTLEAMKRLETIVQGHDQFVTRTTQENMQSLLNQARATFKEKNNLSETEMEKVYEVAGRLQVLPSLLSNVDPITGQTRQVDPLAAMQEAFDLARWNIPELREREMQMKVDEQKSDTKRKQKLSSLGGTSGSVPRTTAEPKNAQERREAMIREVAGMINGEGAN